MSRSPPTCLWTPTAMRRSPVRLLPLTSTSLPCSIAAMPTSAPAVLHWCRLSIVALLQRSWLYRLTHPIPDRVSPSPQQSLLSRPPQELQQDKSPLHKATLCWRKRLSTPAAKSLSAHRRWRQAVALLPRPTLPTRSLPRAPGTAVPTGSVTFKNGTKTLSTMTLNASGKAIFATSTLARGSHSITVVDGGSANSLGQHFSCAYAAGEIRAS